MEKENTDKKFERGIEEINKGEKSEKKNEKHPHSEHKTHRKFEDKDFKEEKDSEPKPIKSNLGEVGKMSELAREKLSDALDKKVDSVVSISEQEGGWLAELDVIDEEYLPDIELRSMSDIIGTYEVKLDNKGELVSWNKKSSRKRGEIK